MIAKGNDFEGQNDYKTICFYLCVYCTFASGVAALDVKTKEANKGPQW